jgi:hypothetical protein
MKQGMPDCPFHETAVGPERRALLATDMRSGRDAGYVALISMGVTLDKDGLVTWPRARDEVGLSAVRLLYHRCCNSCLILSFGLGISFHALRIAHPCWKKRRNEA